MRRVHLYAAFFAAALLVQTSFAQRAQQLAIPLADKPAPKFPDGKINFGSPIDARGLWITGDNRLIIGETVEQTALRDRGNDGGGVRANTDPYPKPKFSEVPFQDWAKAVFIFRQENEYEPYTRCKPAGAWRQVGTAYGTDFIHVPEQQRIYITQTGGPHSFRPIFLDGRPHPTDLEPSYYGHSVGHWEGDTLVVDTVGYNERAWIDLRGIPNTSQLHTIEKFTRLDMNQLKYELTIDDPGAYTRTWTTGAHMRWVPGAEQFEFMCQDGNLAPVLMIGAGNVKVDRSSRIAP